MNIDKLKQLIQAANPEIMALGFGCEIKGDPNKIYLADKMDGSYLLGALSENGKEILGIGAFHGRLLPSEILGRPIRLADVLLAFIKNGIPMSVSSAGAFESWELIDNEWKLDKYTGGSTWFFTDDNLDHQSDECKQFLIDLLCSAK